MLPMSDAYTPLTICLIDDDRIYQFTAKRIIELVNPAQKVLGFYNGQEAIDFFRQPGLTNHDLPDIIFLDINMPVMNGWDFLEELESIKDTFQQLPRIYILSSTVDPEDYKKATAFSLVENFISKPLSKESLEKIG
jgi:CheY-like chemotaxis protein